MKSLILKNVYIALSIFWSVCLICISALRYPDLESAGQAIGQIIGGAILAPILLSSFALFRKKYRGWAIFIIHWQWCYWFFWLGVSKFLGAQIDDPSVLVALIALAGVFYAQIHFAKKLATAS